MLIYGRNSVYEYLIKEEVKKIYFLNGFNDKKILDLCCNLKVKYLDKYSMDKMVNGVHQGIIAEIADFDYTTLENVIKDKDDCTLVILDHLEDPHNLGAIIRTSEAAGIDGIVIPNKRSVLVNPTVIKTSVGAISNIPVSLVVNITNTINYLKKEGFWIVGTDMDGENYTQIDYRGKIAIVIGNEGNGISELVKKSCDYIAKIPMYGSVNSLNASVAAGVMIYEVVRQKRG